MVPFKIVFIKMSFSLLSFYLIIYCLSCQMRKTFFDYQLLPLWQSHSSLNILFALLLVFFFFHNITILLLQSFPTFHLFLDLQLSMFSDAMTIFWSFPVITSWDIARLLVDSSRRVHLQYSLKYFIYKNIFTLLIFKDAIGWIWQI